MYDIIVSRQFLKDAKKYPHLHDQIDKQVEFLKKDMTHPNLHTEKLEPKNLGLYSFRINKQMRGIFTLDGNTIEITSLSKHYE